MHSGRLPKLLVGLAGFAVLLGLASTVIGAQSEPQTRCLKSGQCFCVNSRFEALINDKVALFRGRLHQARSEGKLTAYVSIPLSTRAGSYFQLNAEVAEATAQRLSTTFGSNRLWVLNPATRDADLVIDGTNAGQADYLYMWGQILDGGDGMGADLDLIYFAGPQDFAAFLGMGDTKILDQWGRYFEERQTTDVEFAKLVRQGKIKKQEFISYYGFRAGVSASSGSHDEWNIVAGINSLRREADNKEGIARQLPLWFAGRPVEPGDYEDSVASGNAGACGAVAPNAQAIGSSEDRDSGDRRGL